jgi:RHH-type rel operon transcriptional repressor/antitoxin RelB
MMATVNFRVDEALKEKSYSILKEQGIAPTDFFTSILEYVATTGKLPVKKALLSEEDEELLALVRKRINDPKEMFEEVTLDGVLGILPPYIAKPSEAPVCRGL